MMRHYSGQMLTDMYAEAPDEHSHVKGDTCDRPAKKKKWDFVMVGQPPLFRQFYVCVGYECDLGHGSGLWLPLPDVSREDQ